ncbi:HNH endonuclease [Corynebacterium sp. AOP36-E1-14]|uniref:HNH endonuclease n=1 Tax=Corynebacterium sp. AOP36-E1-14 TaxID=3457682 RepID=UPI004034A0EA
MQTCRTCGESKPTSDYYKINSKRGTRPDCKECHNDKTNRKKWEKRWGTQAPPPKQCRNCGKTVSRRGATYCASEECSRARKAQWFKDNLEKVREQNLRRNAISKSPLQQVVTDDVTWAGVLERDDWECQLCGEKMDRNAKAPSPESATWDHIIPISKGGSHTWDNLQAAHRGCNCRKGDRVALSEESPVA